MSKATAKPLRRAELEALFDALEAAPWAHDFFAVIRRIEALQPSAPRWGSAARPGQEAIRLSQVPELDFAPAALAEFDRRRSVPRLGVRFFGLLGPQGPMPLHLTEYVRERLRNHADPTLARFLDVFHHRLLSLFYRAWAQAQPTVHHDRPTEDRYAAWLGATAGVADVGESHDAVPTSAKLFQAGLIGQRSRHPEALCQVLRQHFGVPAQVQEHVGHWLHMASADRSRLGFARNRSERSWRPVGQLGLDVNAGSKAWDRQFKFRVVLGPLTLSQYLSFLPDGSAWPVLRDWVRLLAGADLCWDLQLVLRSPEIPAPRLDKTLRLGLTSWLGPGGKPAGRARAPIDRRDLRIRPSSQTAPTALSRTGVPHG